jgi:hypothetical protein
MPPALLDQLLGRFRVDLKMFACGGIPGRGGQVDDGVGARQRGGVGCDIEEIPDHRLNRGDGAGWLPDHAAANQTENGLEAVGCDGIEQLSPDKTSCASQE